jgi:hypothetical protein
MFLFCDSALTVNCIWPVAVAKQKALLSTNVWGHIFSPWLGEIVDNPMPLVDYIPQSGTKNSAFTGWDWTTEYIFLLEMKQGYCVCPLSWSIHCNFTGDGNCNERGWACTPHPHQPGQILPSWLNVRQKAAVTTLCTLWIEPWTYCHITSAQSLALLIRT